MAALGIAASEDAHVAGQAARLFHMLATPAEIAADPAVQEAARKVLQRGAPLRPVNPGPARAEFERAVM
jgi:hypothetical protein